MAFVNLSLLLGGLFAAIPIVVHLTMRREPKRQIFPALQFLMERRESNQQQLQLRHWMLLFLRCVVILLLAVALARPNAETAEFGRGLTVSVGGGIWLLMAAGFGLCVVQSRRRTLVIGLGLALLVLGSLLAIQLRNLFATEASMAIGNQRAPVSAVIVVDTSPRMLYQSANRTRLDEARETSLWLVKQFPPSSQIGLVETRPGPVAYAVDANAAQKSLQRLQASAESEPITDTLPRALQLAARGELDRREVYVLSDMTTSAWPTQRLAALSETLKEYPDVDIYVVDVGIDDPSNISIGDLRLSAETLAASGTLTIEAEVLREGEEANAIVDLFIEKPDTDRPVVVEDETLLPEAERRYRQSISLSAEGKGQLRFQIGNLPTGTHQGFVRLAKHDSLAVDDIRYFAVDVQQAWTILMVAPNGVTADFLWEAVAPYEYRQTNAAPFDCHIIEQKELAGRDLSAYAAVCLVDPQPLAGPAWELLDRYVRAGGGLAAFLGHNVGGPDAASVSSFDHPLQRELLGGRISRQWRTRDRDLFIAPQAYNHPLLAPFREQATSVPWSTAPIFRHWVVEDLSVTAAVVFPLTNNKPGLIENRVGAGRVLTLVTPVSDPLRPSGRPTWNELPTSEYAWPFVVLMNESLLYLVDQENRRLNYRAGEAAVLLNDEADMPERYQLFPPDDAPLDIVARNDMLTVRFTERLGPYRLKGFHGGPVVRGFAVNLPAQQTVLTRREWSEIVPVIGTKRLRYARDQSEIEFEVGQGRSGREFYPYLLVLLALFVGIEHLFANRFYPETK
jgi:hypothetical protein